MKRNLCIGILLVAVAGAACGPGLAAGTDTTRAWFDSPLPGTVFTPRSPVCPIVAHGASPKGIATFELSINGMVSSIPSPDTKSSLVTLTRNCDLSQPGLYQLKLRVLDNSGNWSSYAETSLIISALLTGTIPPGPVPPGPIISTPTYTSTPAPLGGVYIQSVSTQLVYVGDSSCGPLDLAIIAHATAPKPIQVVVLFFRFEPVSPSGFQNVAMNPIGSDMYQADLNPTSILGGYLGADQATLQYQVVVQQQGGDTSIRTPVLTDVTLQACGAASVDCTSFNKKAACESHGCKWVTIPGSGTATATPIHACQP